MGAGCASWFWGMAVGFFGKRGLGADFSALRGCFLAGLLKCRLCGACLRGWGAGYGEADSDPPLTVCGRGVLLGVASFIVGDVSPRTWRRIGIRLSIGIVALSRHRGGGATGPGLLLRRRFCVGLGLLWRRIGIRLSIGWRCRATVAGAPRGPVAFSARASLLCGIGFCCGGGSESAFP